MSSSLLEGVLATITGLCIYNSKTNTNIGVYTHIDIDTTIDIDTNMLYELI